MHVYRQNIDHVTADSITLAAGSQAETKQKTFPVDVFVFCTGWSIVSPIFASSLADQLGLPVELDHADARTKSEEQKELEDIDILDRFPVLQHPPQCDGGRPSFTPFHLYKAMVPEQTIHSHSLVFLGKMVVGNNFLASEVQALWAVAYLDGNLKLEKRSVEEETAQTVAWCRRRYLSKGALGSWFYFDVIDYTDMLLAQLGLKSHRQKGWWRNLFAPLKAADLRHLVKEYRSLYP